MHCLTECARKERENSADPGLPRSLIGPSMSQLADRSKPASIHSYVYIYVYMRIMGEENSDWAQLVDGKECKLALPVLSFNQSRSSQSVSRSFYMKIRNKLVTA